MGKFKWFLIGGVLGAGAALAFAPQTGDETRAFVVEKANALAGEAKDFGAGLPDSAKDALKTARDQGSSLLQGAQDAAGVATGKSSDAEADELRAKIEAARQRIAAQVMENAEKTKEAADSTSEAVVESAESVAEAKHAAQ